MYRDTDRTPAISPPSSSHARLIVSALLGLTLALVASDALACEPPKLCASPTDINAAADALCRRARATELTHKQKTLPALEAAEAGKVFCEGRLEQLTKNPPTKPAPWRAPLVLRVGLLVVAVGSGTTAGVLGGIRSAGELVVGFGVVAAAATIAEIVLELLER